MNKIEMFLQLLRNTDVSALAAEGGLETRPILRAIEKASREGDTPELDRQISAFLYLFPDRTGQKYDPANIFLGFPPEAPTTSPELLNALQSATLAALKEFVESKTDGND